MAEILAGLVLIGVFGTVAWNLTGGRTIFVVRIVNGTAVRRRGTVTDKFLAEVTKVAREHALTSGSLWGVKVGNDHLRLRFSRAFPPGSQQQLRNWWNCYGWTAGKV